MLLTATILERVGFRAAALAVVATAATAVNTVTTAIATARTLFTRTRFVNGQGAIIEGVTVETLDGFACAVFGCHFDKAEALSTSGFAVGDQRNAFDFAGLGEQFADLRFSGGVGQIANIQFLSHE